MMADGSIVLAIVQISPLVFISGFRLATKRFPQWWTLIVSDEIDDADADRAGNFEMYTIFTFDWFQSTFALAGSLIYTGLFVFYTANRPEIAYTCSLMAVAAALLVSGILAPVGTHYWFKYQKPEPYCRFFYRGELRFAGQATGQIHDRVSEVFFHPVVSPANLIVLSELLLLLMVGGILLGEPFLAG